MICNHSHMIVEHSSRYNIIDFRVEVEVLHTDQALKVVA